MIGRRSFLRALLPSLVIVALFVVAAPANAAGLFKYRVDLDKNSTSSLMSYGTIYVTGHNPALHTQVRWLHLGVPVVTASVPPPAASTLSVGGANMAVGDVVEVRQSAVPIPVPPVTPPLESYTIPNITLDLPVGSSTVSGSIPGDLIANLTTAPACGSREEFFPLAIAGGTFAQPIGGPIDAGTVFFIRAYSQFGDSMTYRVYSAGETPCPSISATDYPTTPGAPPIAKPYTIYIGGLSVHVSPSVRAALSRGGAELESDESANTYLNMQVATRPSPGDVINVYRPKEAAAPSFSFTIPQVSGKFDPAVDLVAVDGPAAESIDVYPCRAVLCSDDMYRRATDTPAGRTLLSFATPQGSMEPFDLRPDDKEIVNFTAAASHLRYSFSVLAGDLVAPSASVKLSKSFKLAKLKKSLKKGLKLKLSSNEAASADLSLTLPRNLPKKGKLKVKKTTKTITIATAKLSLAPGSKTVTLKFSKAGRKAIAQLIGVGRKLKSQTATLTATVTDASGNVATISSKTSLKR